jgi:hypothetical protein
MVQYQPTLPLSILSSFQFGSSLHRLVGLCGVVLGKRPAPLRRVDLARVPLPPRLLARSHLPRLVHGNRPLCLL